MTEFLLAIDQGTTSTRAMLFDREGRVHRQVQRQLRQHYPHAGWVEHDPNDIWNDTLAVCQETAQDVSIAAVGITNQRETVVLWDRQTGEPVHNAIVWQDRRTAAACDEMIAAGHADLVRERSGLVVDPYFSASKVAWLLDNMDGLRDRAERGEVLFGTVDSWLLWKLTGGRVHATDATNASRTMLYNITEGDWDDDLLELWDIPRAILPEIKDSNADYGRVDGEFIPGAPPVLGIAGDQQAATVGQACFEPGMLKSTYGTGAFLLLNTGQERISSENRLLTTVAYQIDGVRTYAMEGSIFSAGSVVQWLRDRLRIIGSADETESLAAEAPAGTEVYLVPAFTGLGAPYWDAGARGAIVGLTRDAGRPHLARAALESVGYQTRDLFEAMAADGAPAPHELRVDGGMVRNDWLVQFLADVLGVEVRRPEMTETTALGAAFLAGLGAGWFESFDDIAAIWRVDRGFSPTMDDHLRERKFLGWRAAVARVRSQ